jgi:hypothetical protein
MASIVGGARKQKSFDSFLQERTPSLLIVPPIIVAACPSGVINNPISQQKA